MISSALKPTQTVDGVTFVESKLPFEPCSRRRRSCHSSCVHKLLSTPDPIGLSPFGHLLQLFTPA